jgi:hypothetical protein
MDTDYLYEIIVSPDGGSTGQGLVKVIDCLELLLRLPAVVVGDVECNGDRSWVQRPPFCSTTQNVVDTARSIAQFDWATFFFFPHPPSEGVVTYQFEDLFAHAELVIRAVDDTYFYVYSAHQDDAYRLSKLFPVEFQRKGKNAIVHPF